MKDITRLPKWAQDRIRGAEQDAARLRAALSEIPETTIFAGDGFLDPKKYLPSDSTIHFAITGGSFRSSRNRIRVSLCADGGAIEINGDCPLRIKPTASNDIRIFMED